MNTHRGSRMHMEVCNMPLPSERTDVPRNQVHILVEMMLQDLEVGDIDCTEQSDGNYTLRPHPRSSP